MTTTDDAPQPRQQAPWLRIGGIVVSVVSVAAVVWWALRQPSPHLPSTSGEIAWLVGGIGIYFVACALRGERWLLLLHRNGAQDATRADSYALTAVGFMGNNVLPARAGDAMRVAGMAPRAHTGYRDVIGTLVAERILDVVVLVGLFVIVTFGLLDSAEAPEGGRFTLVVVLVVAAVVIGAAVTYWLHRRGTLRKVLDFVKPMVRATANLRGRHGAEALGATIAIWAVEILVWWAVGRAAGLEFGLLDTCYLISLASLFVLIPAAPGYAGTLDAAIIFGIKAIGGSGADAVSYVLLLRFVLLVPITLAGFAALVGRYGGMRFMRTVPS